MFARDDEMRIAPGAAQFVGGFLLLAAIHADHAPRYVIVNLSRLSRQPDERDDRKTSVRFDVQNVLPVTARIGSDLFRRKQISATDVVAQHVRNCSAGGGGI